MIEEKLVEAHGPPAVPSAGGVATMLLSSALSVTAESTDAIGFPGLGGLFTAHTPVTW